MTKFLQNISTVLRLRYHKIFMLTRSNKNWPTPRGGRYNIISKLKEKCIVPVKRIIKYNEAKELKVSVNYQMKFYSIFIPKSKI